jgi:hypothetical protein
MIGNANRDSSVAVAGGGSNIPGDVAGSACIISGSRTDMLEGMKGIVREATIHAPHSHRTGLRPICADRSSARAAKPINKLTTTE